VCELDFGLGTSLFLGVVIGLIARGLPDKEEVKAPRSPVLDRELDQP
jgi:hypothetical protein